MPEETKYLIVSLKKEDIRQDWLWFWKADLAGYTTEVNKAGRYSESTIKENPDRYNNRINCIAIPEEKITKMIRTVAVNPGKVLLDLCASFCEKTMKSTMKDGEK